MAEDDFKLLGGAEFDDPTRSDQKKAQPSWGKAIIGISLLLCAVNFLVFVWQEKWAKDQTTILSTGETVDSDALRWGWKPYRLEYQLYLERGYDLSWLEGEKAKSARDFFGDYSSFFELFALRCYGLLSYGLFIVLVFLFMLSLGSVRYYDKKFEFKHISSTLNNAAIKVLFLSIVVSVIWCSLPFGMKLPIIGGLPILAKLPFFGVSWMSNPALGAGVIASFYAGVAYVLGANFSRDI